MTQKHLSSPLTVLISVTRSVIGIILGTVMAMGTYLFAGWDTVISFYRVVASFGISALVGIAFGLYPEQSREDGPDCSVAA